MDLRLSAERPGRHLVSVNGRTGFETPWISGLTLPTAASARGGLWLLRVSLSHAVEQRMEHTFIRDVVGYLNAPFQRTPVDNENEVVFVLGRQGSFTFDNLLYVRTAAETELVQGKDMTLSFIDKVAAEGVSKVFYKLVVSQALGGDFLEADVTRIEVRFPMEEIESQDDDAPPGQTQPMTQF
jgi:hypothetical protein